MIILNGDPEFRKSSPASRRSYPMEDKSAMSKTGLFLIICSVLASAQEVPPAADNAKTAAIEGVVINELTKDPIRRAEINLYKQGKLGGLVGGGSAYSALTDATGKFRIDKIEPGDYMLSPRKAGFIATRAYFGLSERILKLAVGASFTGLR